MQSGDLSTIQENQGTTTLAVAFEEVHLGPEAALTRTSSRQCLACAHKATSVRPPGSVQSDPVPVLREPVSVLTPVGILDRGAPEAFVTQVRTMSAKSERGQEALEDRDPNRLNQHVQIVWDDIVGEPEGARSPECAWRLSHNCFRYARNWCYTLLSVLLAPPCALCLGCGFACLAFEQIWCTAPCLRCAKIYFASLRTLVFSCMAATVVPTAEALGHFFRHIRLNVRRDAPEDQDLLIV